MIQTNREQLLVVVALSVLVTTASLNYAHAGDESRHTKDAEKDRNLLPLSTAVSESVRRKLIISRQTSIHWDNMEYGIDDGIDVLMRVITDPTTDGTQRASAINKLAHFSTLLQGRECLSKLCAIYNNLGSRMEKKQVLICLTIAKDPIGLKLLYRVATTEPDPIIRFHAAAGLAEWNIREGVRQLIELFPSAVETGLRQVGAAAMISFTSLNERKEWNCPQDEIRQKALAKAGGNRKEYANAAMREYRKWFEANKRRFPDWQPGDPLPEVGSKQEGEARTKGE